MTDALRQLADELTKLPMPEIVEDRTFDAVGCLVVGRKLDEGMALAELTATLAGAEAGVCWSAGKLDQVFADVAIARLTELDDIHMASCTTAGAVVVPTAITVAAVVGADPERYAQAVSAGYEAMTRLGLAIDGARVVYKGIWPSCLSAAFGTAAVTAQLIGLDVAATADALSLALTMGMSTGGGHHAPLPGRWVTIGQSARSGCLAALAAARGYSAPLDLGRYPPAPINLDRLLSGGRSRAIDEVSVKPFPGAKQTMTATEAALQLRDQVRLDEIERIVVSVPEMFAGMISERPDGGRQSRLVSVRWMVAVALCCPERLTDLHRSPFSHPELPRLIDAIGVRGDPALSAEYPQRWPARVQIHTGAQVLEQLLFDSHGDPGRRGGTMLDEKWAAVLGADAHRLRRLCSAALDSSSGLRWLADELRPTATPNARAT